MPFGTLRIAKPLATNWQLKAAIPQMEEIKSYYNFEIDKTDFFFDNEISYNLNEEKISDLHLLHFRFPDKEFHILISTKNNGFIDYGFGSSFTNFLIENGVSYRPYDGTSYKFLLAPDRMKIVLKDGPELILEMKHPHFIIFEGIFKYQVPQFKINFKKTLQKEVIEKLCEADKTGELPKSIQKYLAKQERKNIIGLVILILIVVVFIYLL